MRDVCKHFLLTAFLLFTATIVVARDYCMPTHSRKVTSKFGCRWGRQHMGLDIKVRHGDPISAAFKGVVVNACYGGGYGYYVVLKHEKGYETRYAHMSRLLVKAGQEVSAGDTIGLGGNTGRSTGSHLHFEVRINGKAVDPSELFDFNNQALLADLYQYKGVSVKRHKRGISPQRQSCVPATYEVRPVCLPTVITSKRWRMEVLSPVSGYDALSMKWAKKVLWPCGYEDASEGSGASCHPLGLLYVRQLLASTEKDGIVFIIQPPPEQDST